MSKDVFFFGSGFSKSLINAYPTLNDLSKYIKEKLSYEKGSVKLHFENEVPNSFHDNVEDLLTYLSSRLPYKTDVQILADETLYKDITSKLAKYFYYLREQYSTYYTAENDNKIFAKYILENKCTCITLNYDLVLEDLLYKNTSKEYQRANSNYSVFYKIPIVALNNRVPTGYGCLAEYETDFHRTEMPEIIKLHGSINWLSVGQSNTDTIYSAIGNEKEYLKTDLNTFIVPPVLDKQSQYNNIILRALWKRAFNAIENAENIYIYGFSFPSTDYSIKFLFQSALRNNPNCKIYVINTKESFDELKKRYDDVFGNNKCDFDCCVENNQLNSLLEIINSIKLKI